jgi:hypothetical protein
MPDHPDDDDPFDHTPEGPLVERQNWSAVHEAAHKWRSRQASELIENICFRDPATGEMMPCYEPDPDKPGYYRATAAYLRAQEQGNDHA